VKNGTAVTNTPVLDKYLSGGLVKRDELWAEVQGLDVSVMKETPFLWSLYESLKEQYEDAK